MRARESNQVRKGGPKAVPRPQGTERSGNEPSIRSTARGASPRASLSADRGSLTVHVSLKLHRRGGRKHVVTPDGVIGLTQPRPHIDNVLVKALARAHRWQRLIEDGTHGSVAEIARAEKINDSYVSRLLRLTLLAPSIVEVILDGRQAPRLQIETLLKPMPVEWAEQRELPEFQAEAGVRLKRSYQRN